MKLLDILKEDDLNDYYHIEPGAAPENNTYELGEGHLIKHKWNKTDNRTKLNHHKCERCGAEKWWDSGFGKVVYQDRFGNLSPHKVPSCVLPNTKV